MKNKISILMSSALSQIDIADHYIRLPHSATIKKEVLRGKNKIIIEYTIPKNELDVQALRLPNLKNKER